MQIVTILVFRADRVLTYAPDGQLADRLVRPGARGALTLEGVSLIDGTEEAPRGPVSLVVRMDESRNLRWRDCS